MVKFLPNSKLGKNLQPDYFGDTIILNTESGDLEAIFLTYDKRTDCIRAFDSKYFKTYVVHNTTRELIKVTTDYESMSEKHPYRP